MQGLQAGVGEILQQELAQLGRLALVLELEHEALKVRDTDALTKNTKEKQQLIDEVEALGRGRLAMIQAAGYTSDKEGILAAVDAEPQLRVLWEQLEVVLLRCQKQNQVNGMLLEKGKQQTQQLLGILLGEGNCKDTELYNAKGSASASFLNGRSVKV